MVPESPAITPDSEKRVFSRLGLGLAVAASVGRLGRPIDMVRCPALLVVEAGALVATGLAVHSVHAHTSVGFHVQVAIWLWVGLWVAHVLQALAEGPGKSRTEALRLIRDHTLARRPDDAPGIQRWAYAHTLRKGDVVLVDAGGAIPGDGEIVEGVATVDESAITGESAPVVREAGGDRSAVLGGSRVLSGRLTIRIAADAGETSLDQVIGLVESAATRRRARGETVLVAVQAALGALFLLAMLALVFLEARSGVEAARLLPAALLVCLMPATVSGLPGALGVAGIRHMLAHNALVMRGHALGAAGRVDSLVVDAVGTVPGRTSGESARRCFAELRQQGIHTVMVAAGDRASTEALAAEAGVDDFVAEAAAKTKRKLVVQEQERGHVVALIGDEMDAPALAQADLAVTLHPFTEVAREAGDVVELDGDLAKLVDIVEVGRQFSRTRARLAAFTVANDLVRFLAVVPAALASVYPPLGALNFLRLATPQSAILAAAILNPLTLGGLVLLAFWGLGRRPSGAAALSPASLLPWAAGGLIAPLLGLKLIDLLLVAAGLA